MWADDAYITLRYSRNLWQGQGLVFNPGEHVEGITNLGWALLLAPFTAGDGMLAAKVLGLLAALGTLGLLGRWSERRELGLLPSAALYAPVVLLPWMASWAGQGLETAAVMFLVTAGWTLYEEELDGGLPWASLAIGLAPWFRPDAALLAMAVLGVHLLSARDRWGRTSLRAAAIVTAGALSLVLTKLLLFGSILPNTFAVKVDGGWMRGVGYLASFFQAPTPWVAPLLYAGVGYGIWRLIRRDRSGLPALVALGWTAMCVGVGGDYFDNYRLLVPALPAFGAGLALAAQALPAWPRRLAVAGLLLACGGQAGVDKVHELSRHEDLPRSRAQTHLKQAPFLKPWTSPRFTLDQGADGVWPVAWVVTHAPAGAGVAYTELGLFSYTSDLYVADPLGLTTPELAQLDEVQDEVVWLSGHVDLVAADIHMQWFERHRAVMRAKGWVPLAACDSWWVFQTGPGELGGLSDPQVAERVAFAKDAVPRMSVFHELLDRRADCDQQVQLDDPTIWPPGIEIPEPVEDEATDTVVVDESPCEQALREGREAWEYAAIELDGPAREAALEASRARDFRALKNLSLEAVPLSEHPWSGAAHAKCLRAFEICRPVR